METIIVIGAVIAIYVWWSGKKRAADERWKFAHPSYEDVWADDAGLRWRFDLEEMKAEHTWWSVPERTIRRHDLRRVGISAWEVRLGPDSWKEEVADLSLKKDQVGLRDVVPARLDRLKDGPVWEPLRDDFAAKLENDYQRFLHSRA